jgi:protocatechuate 3,4-dioxygenase, alpha subunit
MSEPIKKPDGITPSATVGPYFKYGLTPAGVYPVRDAFSSDVTTPDAQGERIRITGRVFDGDGKPMSDSMIEIWQADAAGRYAHPRDGGAKPNATFKGFGRADTDAEGRFGFDTIKPGSVAGPRGTKQAPHILVAVFARGMPKHVYTRIYFAEDAAAHATDPVLALVPAARRNTLIANRGTDGAYVFDIRIQGPNETVFFDL